MRYRGEFAVFAKLTEHCRTHSGRLTMATHFTKSKNPGDAPLSIVHKVGDGVIAAMQILVRHDVIYYSSRIAQYHHRYPGRRQNARP